MAQHQKKPTPKPAATSRAAKKPVKNTKKSALQLKKTKPAPKSSEAADRKHFPYVAADGVDIRNAEDERNWEKYGTTDPDGGE